MARFVRELGFNFLSDVERSMKNYIVYIDGVEEGIIKAKNHNDAERKAHLMFASLGEITVAYTEI